MRFKLDQNLPVEAASLLAAVGHDAMTVHQQRLAGAFKPQKPADKTPKSR